ncbi:MAG: hypothetical protein N2999_00785 [Proteobacteria bacterium]|nr:hypothetical protein [Pseudomonadota bacterium]
MKKVLLSILVIIFLIPDLSHSKKPEADISAKAQKFYDDFMDMASYGRKRDFYDNYIDFRELTFDEFSKIIDESDIKIEGSYKSKLISWEAKGNEVEVFLKLAVKRLKRPENYEKNIKIVLKKKDDSLILSKKELLKIYTGKRSKKR